MRSRWVLLALLWMGMYALLLAQRSSVMVHDVPRIRLFGLWSSHLIITALSLVVGGWLADRYGSRNLILSSLALFALVAVPRVFLRERSVDLVFVFGSGIAYGLFFGAAAKLVAEQFAPGGRSIAFAILMGSQAVFVAIGSLWEIVDMLNETVGHVLAGGSFGLTTRTWQVVFALIPLVFLSRLAPTEHVVVDRRRLSVDGRIATVMPWPLAVAAICAVLSFLEVQYLAPDNAFMASMRAAPHVGSATFEWLFLAGGLGSVVGLMIGGTAGDKRAHLCAEFAFACLGLAAVLQLGFLLVKTSGQSDALGQAISFLCFASVGPLWSYVMDHCPRSSRALVAGMAGGLGLVLAEIGYGFVGRMARRGLALDSRLIVGEVVVMLLGAGALLLHQYLTQRREPDFTAAIQP